MQKILRRRNLRQLKTGAPRYAALFLLVVMSVYMLVSLLGAAQIVIDGVAEHAEANRIEDGQFQTFVPLTEEEEAQIRTRGVDLERHFYLDYDLNGATMRLFTVRKDIDRIELVSGTLPEGTGESGSPEDAAAENADSGESLPQLVLERRFSEVNEIAAGDILTLGGQDFTVCGVGTVPDYDNPLKGMTDSTADSKQFGLAFIPEDVYESMRDAGTALGTETFIYAYRLNGAMDDTALRKMIEDFPFDADDVTDPWFRQYRKELEGSSGILLDFADLLLTDDENELKDTLSPKIHILQLFVKQADNMRIGASADDLYINLYGCLVAGVIILALFGYVFAVFIIHEIEEDSTSIGALYALGIRGKELLVQYTAIPVLVTGIGGILGTLLGYMDFGVRYQMQDTYNYFSVPDLEVRLIPYILIYGIVLPPLITFVTDYIVIRKSLNKPAVQLLRRERKVPKLSSLRLGKLSFTHVFRIRQMLRESRAALTVLAGMFISLLLIFISVDCWVMCGNIMRTSPEDTKYEYMYLYKYPEKEVPEGGEAAYAKTVRKEIFGYHLDVTILGLPENDRYFDAHPVPGKKEVSVSSAMAQKYGLSVGDTFTLDDEETERLYAFTVREIVQYSPAFYVFMDIDSMRDLFDEADDYYNVVFSDTAIDIPAGRLYSTMTRQSIIEAADVFIDLMWSMIYTMLGMSTIIFVVVMYLMISVMIEHSSYDISLMKIFGYREKEVRSLYLTGNFILVALGTLVVLPLAKLCIDKLYPYFISNVACGMDLTMSPVIYLIMYAAILLLFLIVSMFLHRKLSAITPAEVLKTRE